jgi:DNA-nicking Smr family endonuclease
MTKLNKKDIQAWLDATQDVKKIKQKNSHVEKSEFFYTNDMHFSKLKHESEIAYTATMLEKDKLLESDFRTKHASHSQDDIKSARKSVDKKLQLKLKNGNIRYQDRIDLHGMLLKQAKDSLVYFLQTSQQMGLKCVLVIHGKGTNTESNIGQIKQQIPYWLENLDCVLSFTSALPKHGGTGAMYVLLRRIEKQR